MEQGRLGPAGQTDWNKKPERDWEQKLEVDEVPVEDFEPDGEILEPSQRDIFNHLTRMKMTPAYTFKNSLKEQSSYSVNIGLPSHSIPSCRHWPAYVTHTSPVVKMLVEQDKLRKAGPQGTSQDCRQRTGSSKKRWPTLDTIGDALEILSSSGFHESVLS
ncbi:CMT1A duplicated region transcript 4 protein [Alligator mississippiensis]|uniref:CMT1A duplicated region transcript 4 protein n=1 Tax=Alligator mississippiensis TaxID=8496 RepID=A0A151NV82_ALLMI|nr:CMT1A duplicated region transcript 4 protein [Alligator mississippiensis]